MNNEQVKLILSHLLTADRNLYSVEKEAILFAIDAVDRMTPKRPYSLSASKVGYSKKLYKGYCPHCEVTQNVKRVTRYSVEKHCNICGQALDWEDNDGRE